MLLTAAVITPVWAFVTRVVRIPPPVLDVRIDGSFTRTAPTDPHVPLCSVIAWVVEAGSRRSWRKIELVPDASGWTVAIPLTPESPTRARHAFATIAA